MSLASLVVAAAAVANFKSVQLESVYDGDTFKVNLPRQEEIFGRRVSVRIRGINAPELKSTRACEREDAEKSRDGLSKFLEGKRIDLGNCRRDKYFRIACDVFTGGVLENDAAASQLSKRLAIPYNGRMKPEWVCLKKK